MFKKPISYLVYYAYLRHLKRVYTPVVYFLLKFSKIQIGSKCGFWGLPVFVRHQDSTITIGNNCNFHSKAISNLSGISKRCMISTYGSGAAVKIGNSSGFSGTAIIAIVSIQIGNNVMIGANSFIMDFDGHNVNPLTRHDTVPVSSGRPIVIEDNVFIGYSSTVLKGVRIGENSVIGANSMVVSDIPPNCIAAGNPCKVVSKIRM